MQPQALLLERRREEFESFYKGLIPSLVEFVDRLGIKPSHEVLNHAVQFAPNVDAALEGLEVSDSEDRVWLLTRVGYFVGEYFAQKLGGCWYVNDVSSSRYFARYVVGRFAQLGNSAVMLDPFEVGQAYVDTPIPRKLTALLTDVEAELLRHSA